MSLEAVISQHNHKGLRQLYNLMESHIRSLHSLGVPHSSFGTLLASIFMNRLPSEFRLAVSREIVDDQWELDAIMKVVEREIDARERAAASSRPSVKRHSREPPTATTLMSTDTSTICAYCDQDHHSSQCRVVVDVKLRKGMLMKAGRCNCFLCLKRGHLTKTFHSSAKCSSCQQRHHSSICENVHTPSNANPARAAVSTPSNAQVNPAQR